MYLCEYSLETFWGKMDEQNCVLCLRTSVDIFPILEDNLIAILYDILQKSVVDSKNLAIHNITLQQNMVCYECQDNLQIFYNFKMAYVLDKRLPVRDCKYDTSLDQEEIENKQILDNSSSTEYVQTLVTCRFCTKIIINLCFIPLNNLKKNTLLVNMLKRQIPELNLDNTEHISSCESCHESLKSLLNFLLKCFNVEKKMCTDDKSQIDLKRIPEFKSTIQQGSGCCNIVENEGRHDENQTPFVIKSEPDLGCENENDLAFIKPEEINIKSEVDNTDGYNGDLKQHFLNQKDSSKVSEKKKYRKCTDCSFESMYPKNLWRHKLSHKNPMEVTMHKCEVCTFETKYSNNLRAHMVFHKDPSERRKLKCEDCTYVTTIRSRMRRHKTSHKDPSDIIMYKCDICEYKAQNKGHLKRHMRLHKEPAEGKRYKCKDCAYETTSNLCMLQHGMSHKDHSHIIVHKCEMCAYETIHKKHVKRHMLVHKDPSEVEKYKCKDCRYEAIHHGTFLRHRMTHKDPSEIVVYKCELCTYETKFKSNLKHHVLIHRAPSERKRYKCEECTYETTISSCMWQHRISHRDPSDIKMHKCELCTYETIRKRDLKRHVLTHASARKNSKCRD